MSDYTFESKYWGNCCNTFDEDQKHYVYAKLIGLNRVGYSFDVNYARVIDIGGGPTSMLLKTINLGAGLVVDPLNYPEWVYWRYEEADIGVSVKRGEDINGGEFDEAWIYNCLQHTDDPELIIKNALKAAKTLRIFEWVDIPAHEGHPIQLSKDNLDKWIGKEGNVVQLAESGCYGKAYYNIHKQ